jgi:hypothetical protein
MGISVTIPGRNKHHKQLPIDTSMLVMVEDLTMTEGGFRDQCVVAHTLAAFAILSTTLLQGSEGCQTEASKHPDKAKADTEVAAVILTVRRGSPRPDGLNKIPTWEIQMSRFPSWYGI